MRVKRIMSFVIILSIVLCSSITFSGATVLAKAEEKVFSTATLEDDFADNQVIVIMKNATSLKFMNTQPQTSRKYLAVKL